jgi:uncharacterized phiE125 gp8 family phage protein
MHLTLTTPATVEPVTVAELKSHLRLDGSDEDPYLETLIETARMEAENYTGRQFVNATWSWVLDRFPCSSTFELPKAPLSSVTSITYTDDQGNTGQVWDASKYIVDAPSGPYVVPGRVSLAYGQSYPNTYPQINVITILFVAGYGATAASVPAPIKQAILLIAAEMYERRAQVTLSLPQSKNAITAQNLLSGFRVTRWTY